MASERDAYVVLQVQPEAAQDVVQAAYRSLARRYHPDGQTPHIERMKEINLAYERVRTVERRTEYDAERRRRLIPVGPGRDGVPQAGGWGSTGAAAVGGAAPTTTAPVRPPFGFRPTQDSAQAAPDVVDFGQYTGWRIAQIARHDPDYLRWLSRHSAGVRYLEVIRRYLAGERDLGRRSSAIFDW